MEEYRIPYQENVSYPSQWQLYPANSDSLPDHPYLRLTDYRSDALSRYAEPPKYGLSAIVENDGSKTLAERIFGAQMGQNRYTAHHLGKLLRERHRIYREHQGDLQEEINNLSNRLKIGGGAYSVIPPQVTANLQKNLLKLESDQRKEQIDFWKDSMEVRAKMLETTLDYQSTLSRARILGSLGGQDV